MKKEIRRSFLSILCLGLLLASPVTVVAEPFLPGQDASAQQVSGVVVSEVQTGAAARADEFVELYNATDEAIDLTGWQIRYITASATSTKNVTDPSNVVTLTPPADIENNAVLVPPGGYYVLYSGSVVLPPGVPGQQYEGLLPATGGSLVLVSPDNMTCEFVLEDALAWGSTTHLFGEGQALVAGSSSSSDRLYQRYADLEGVYVDTGDNARDFQAGSALAATVAPTPGADNAVVLPETPLAGSGVQSLVLPERFANADCTLPDPDTDPDPPVGPESPPSVVEPPQEDPDQDDEPDAPIIPAGNVGLKPPLLSELLPNPASPRTDKDDEFIELYNPNQAAFDLNGYVLEVGLKTKKRYVIPAGTVLPPQSFLAFFSADTNLALSNSGSQVVLVDPLGKTLAISEAYATAKDGQSWVLANGKWQWTTKPTPNALNVVSVPVVKASQSKKKTSAGSNTKNASAGQTKGSTVKEGEEDVQQLSVVAATNGTPLHPGILAAVAVSALLYGAYEYRHDVANRLYQFRTNRAARRALRQSTQGR